MQTRQHTGDERGRIRAGEKGIYKGLTEGIKRDKIGSMYKVFTGSANWGLQERLIWPERGGIKRGEAAKGG